MKTTFRSVILLGTCGIALASALTAHSQDSPWSRWYVKGDLGGAWTANTELKEYFGPVAPGSKVKFDTGVRLGVAAGYQVTDWFAGELETGIMENEIRSITGATRLDAFFSNVPFLLNAKFQCPHLGQVTPYFGGGFGGSAAVLDAEHITINGTRSRGTESDTVFAYQAFAGVRYNINDRMGVGLEYHYFGTTEPEWRADFTFNTASDKVRFGRIETHVISVVFNYSF